MRHATGRVKRSSAQAERHRSWSAAPAVLFAVYLAAPTVWGMDEAAAPPSPPVASDAYTLHVNTGLVSVQAREASLLAILQALGKQAGFVVTSNLTNDPRVTLDFTNQPLRQAVQRLTEGTDAVAEFGEQPDGLKRLILLSGDRAETLPEKAATPPPSERPDPKAPFQFELDPSAVMPK